MLKKQSIKLRIDRCQQLPEKVHPSLTGSTGLNAKLTVKRENDSFNFTKSL